MHSFRIGRWHGCMETQRDTRNMKRKALMTTTALAFAGAMAAGSASAADMLSVGVGGYMEQWVGFVDRSDSANDAVEGGIDQWSDSEIFFRGKLEADNGLTFSVKVELEGNTAGDQIDESQLTIGGSFGQIVLGTEDHPAALMHYGNQDVGVGYCGDSGWTGVTGCSRNGEMGLGTNGWIVGGDEQKIAYYTPRISGVQFGAAYIPDHTAEDSNGTPNGNNNDGFSVAVNLKHDLGDTNVAASAGHYQVSNDGGDDQTWTNFGLRVGFGAFGFNVAYAEHEDGDGDDMDTGDYNLTSAGAKYSDGPMAVSLTHMMGEADNGEEGNVTMLSLAYTLAPGVASKTSVIAGEQGTVDGTAFVTGIAVGF
ncbi:MAG: porin [Alphaproteobacteria bacterium]|nr:porin [Alphaproteobacteria bacterium]